MSISRLRLRLAGTSAIGFFLGLVTASVGIYAFLVGQASRRFSSRLETDAAELETAIQHELVENPQMTLQDATADALAEWPDQHARFLVSDVHGSLLGMTAMAVGDSVLRLHPPAVGAIVDTTDSSGEQVRIHRRRANQLPGVDIIAIASTLPLRQDGAALVRWLAISVPVVLGFSMLGGYLLSRSALAPLDRLAELTGKLDPANLGQRLRVTSRPDEVDRLAIQINGLLDRIERAQWHNRRFIARAAHQLKTPLTLILGESALSLERHRPSEEHREALRRVELASAQMARRVQELLLLARAQAGERLELVDRVELDGLVVETAQLMSNRAKALRRNLEFGQVESIEVQGAEWLLREALLELVENACRHGSPNCSVRIGVFRIGERAMVEVRNGDAIGRLVPGEVPMATDSLPTEAGLGLSMLAWIAQVHGGRLVVTREGEQVAVSLDLPVPSHSNRSTT